MGVFRALGGVSLAVVVAGTVGCAVDRSGLSWLAAGRGEAGIDPSPWGDAGPDAGEADAESPDLTTSPPPDAALDLSDDRPGDTGAPIPDSGRDVTIDRAPEARPDPAPDVAPDLRPDVALDVPADVRPPTDVPAEAAVDLPVDTRPTCGASQHPCGQSCADNSSVATCGGSCVPCDVPANGGATCDGTTCGIACNPNFVPSPSGTSCVRSCMPTCEAGAVVVTAPGNRFTGVTAGASGNTGSCGGSAAPDAVFQVVVTTPSDLFVTTHGTRFDTVIYLRRGCCGSELACNDNADGRRTSVLSMTNLPAGVYQVFVDGAAATDAGAFSVDIFVSPTSSGAGDSCGRPTRIGSTALTGTTCGLRKDTSPETNCSSADSDIDAFYYFVLDEPATVSFDTCTATCLDTVLYMRDVCTVPTSQLACNDDDCNGCGSEANSLQSRASARLAAGVHYLVLDSLIGNTCGPFTLTPMNVPL